MITHLIPRVAAHQGTVIGGSASSLVTLIAAQERRRPGGQALLSGRAQGDLPFSEALPPGLRLHRLKMRASPVSARYGLEFSIRAAMVARDFRDTSLLHGHSGRWPYVGATRALASRLNAPWVHTLYCPVPASSFARHFLPRLAGTAAALVGMSRNVASSAIAAGVPESRVFHINPCIDLERFQPRGSVSETRAKLHLGGDAEVVLFVGNDSEAKGFETLWSAFQRLAPLRERLRLVATFEDKGSDGSASLAPTPVSDRCRFLGVVPDMGDLMEAADVIVFPFRHTSGPSDYPTAMLEAMAIGTPVVATNVGGIPEVVVDGETGLLIPKDQPAALLTAVERMLDNPEKAVAMATVAQRMAQDRFNPEVVSRQWDELYESISAPSGVHTYAR